MSKEKPNDGFPEGLLKLIDHTNLNPNATDAQIAQLCDEAIEFGFGAVCVAPNKVSSVRRKFSASGVSDVGVVSVIGFPHGNTLAEVKEYETHRVLQNGATEIDMVMSLGDFESGNFTAVQSEIEKVVNAAQDQRATVKVILETYLLMEDEKIRKACKLALEAGANFVKTSTGFLISETSDPKAIDKKLRAVKVMLDEVGGLMGVKVSGGISSLSTAMMFFELGVSRFGCSSSVKIARELQAAQGDK